MSIAERIELIPVPALSLFEPPCAEPRLSNDHSLVIECGRRGSLRRWLWTTFVLGVITRSCSNLIPPLLLLLTLEWHVAYSVKCFEPFPVLLGLCPWYGWPIFWLHFINVLTIKLNDRDLEYEANLFEPTLRRRHAWNLWM